MFQTTRNAAEPIFPPVCLRSKGQSTVLALSLVNKVFRIIFSIVRGVICPLPFSATALRAKFLCAIIMIGGRKELGLAEKTYSFSKGFMPPSVRGMMKAMFFIRHHLKIFNTIICSIAVNVMNMLRRYKFSSYVFRHYISMFKHSILAAVHRVGSYVDKYIPVFSHASPTSPVGMIFTIVTIFKISCASLNSFFHDMSIEQVYSEVNS